MKLGMIGLGRMGANMAARLLAGRHECVVHDVDAAAVDAAATAGATPAASLDALAAALEPPRAVWIMVPADALEGVVGELAPHLTRGDVVVDGGNSHYVDTVRRARELRGRGIALVDVGTSGGVWGRELGFCQMVGGDADAVARLRPVFESLAAGERDRAGYLHCGPSGTGHFVKMVHNGIEYGMMQAYAEGLNLLAKARFPEPSGAPSSTADAAERTDAVDLDLAAITSLWRRGSVVRSWLLELISDTLADDPGLDRFEGAVGDSGEGRWMLEAAVEQRVPAPALAAALFTRFSSRGRSDFGDRVLSAMRHAFGGHAEPGER